MIRKKLSKRKKLVKALDEAVSIFIRLRDKRSVISGKTENLTNGHLFSRDAYSTRWDISPDGNCHAQTMGENLRHEYCPYPYTRWYIQKFGIEKYDELYRRYRTVKKLKDWELEELLNQVREATLRLKVDNGLP